MQSISPIVEWFKGIVGLALTLGILFGTNAAQPSYSVQSWNSVLGQAVDERGMVDYDALQAKRDPLDHYLAIIRNFGPNTTPSQFPTTAHKLAYYINAYNALVFDGVLARGPEKESVWKGLISGLNFFVRMDVELDGMTTNLRNLENKIIRAQFADPRIHAALNCASISCPRLPQKAFEPSTLYQQLQDAMVEFVHSEANVAVDVENQTVRLSEIFDWFKEDFIDFEIAQGNPNPSLLDYINRYRADNLQIDPSFEITFIPYNKGINSQ